MSASSPCLACTMGEHAGHVEQWNEPLPGVLGGAHCPCEGDCTPSSALMRSLGSGVVTRPPPQCLPLVILAATPNGDVRIGPHTRGTL